MIGRYILLFMWAYWGTCMHFNPNHIVFEFHILALKVVFLREHEKIV